MQYVSLCASSAKYANRCGGRPEWRLIGQSRSLQSVYRSPGRLGDRKFHTLHSPGESIPRLVLDVPVCCWLSNDNLPAQHTFISRETQTRLRNIFCTSGDSVFTQERSLTLSQPYFSRARRKTGEGEGKYTGEQLSSKALRRAQRVEGHCLAYFDNYCTS